MSNTSEDFMRIAESLERDYLIAELGVKSKVWKEVEETEYQQQYLEMIIVLKDAIELLLDLSEDTGD